MISVNGTLFIQMAAFLVAWRFLDRFLLKPLVSLIKQEAIAQEQLEESLEKIKSDMVARDRHKQERWFNYQMLFARSTPSLSLYQPSCFLAQTRIIPAHMSDAERQDLQQTTAALLAARITNEF